MRLPAWIASAIAGGSDWEKSKIAAGARQVAGATSGGPRRRTWTKRNSDRGAPGMFLLRGLGKLPQERDFQVVERDRRVERPDHAVVAAAQRASEALRG